MTETASEKPPLAIEAAVYTIAFFAGSPFIILSVIMPLWALELGASPIFIGLIISSRQILVITMAVHGGALLDRFGPRLVIFLSGAVGGLTMALFPFFPYLAVIVVLQAISGFAETITWIGAQTLVGRLLGGRPVYAGRMTSSARVGSFIGPVLGGLVWKYIGADAAFWFIGAWVFTAGVSALTLPATPPAETPETKKAAPEPEAVATPETRPQPAAPRKRTSVLPSFADYATTYRLLLLPAVALVIAVTFMRQTGSGIQSSFYGVWLKQAGYDADAIGLFLGVSNAASAASALTVGWLTRRFSEHWALLGATVLAIGAIAVTPLLDGFWILLIAISLRGVGQGWNFPIMVAIASRAVGQHLQGRVVALRITFNRLGGALVPFLMGVLAEIVGIEAAFYVIGIAGLFLIGGLGVWISRTPEFAGGPRR
ncbi:MAG: MFS transporter [Alphaproteobacteria bacterium]|nr:MFS transporter [Alphaproteobacteria bacterium]